MKDEIKEILEYLKNDFYAYGETYIEEKCKIVTKKENQQLLDYITNLQEENERLKEENKRIFSKVNDDELLISNAMNYAEAQDYKSRCEKANNILKDTNVDMPETLLIETIDYARHILNGGCEE